MIQVWPKATDRKLEWGNHGLFGFVLFTVAHDTHAATPFGYIPS